MIISEIFYGVKCNRCGETCEEEHAFWSDEGSAIDNAMESEWMEDKGKHYCTNCYDFDEETEERTAKPDFPEYIKKTKKFIDKMLLSYSATISEKEDYFEISTVIYSGTTFEKFEENYIKELLGENLISLEYQKHERFTRYDCVILVKRKVAQAII